ncbi:hypothetical protein EYF80_020280 [Liparis tanakae]|uniref:Uncharacterized protein n=1 Tax=Liparis tanakae TaxID=230148 RepID=A0A4Z2HUC1_9TELE|nr:hypothetical protein EYF80_020280 [Liparis tanakae]
MTESQWLMLAAPAVGIPLVPEPSASASAPLLPLLIATVMARLSSSPEMGIWVPFSVRNSMDATSVETRRLWGSASFPVAAISAPLSTSGSSLSTRACMRIRMRTEDRLYALAATRRGCGSSEEGEGSSGGPPCSSPEKVKEDVEGCECESK